MIMQSNTTMMKRVIINRTVESCMAVYFGMAMEYAIIGRHGGCFEEDIRGFMCDRAYHITGFGCTGEVCTNSQGEKGQCTVPKRLENCGKVSVRIIHGLTLVIKNSYTYCKNLLALEAKYYYACS